VEKTRFCYYVSVKVLGKVIVVTGAGSGIGKALVKELLSRGSHVVAVDLRQASLDALASECNHDYLTAHCLDITDRRAVEALVPAIRSAKSSVDGLINCAGIIQPFVRVNELDYHDIEHVMNVNFFGTLHMIKAFLPLLLERPEAHIVNVSSMGGFLPVPGQSVYGASKAAVKLLSEGLYAELRDTPVRVSVVFPGATDTGITKNSDVTAPDLDTTGSKYPTASPEKVATQIIDAMQKNKLRIYTGKDSPVMNALYRLAPTYATNLIARKMRSLLSPRRK
jgi:short-subunit dehydrogenase